ncbi:putative RNA-directed DNA polymerase, eukaryota, reverse transcriptase zinc-binding domain protein [Tanacetum coccineum]
MCLDLRNKVDTFDNKAELTSLSPTKVEERNNFIKLLANFEHRKVKDLRQLVKLQWVAEGDENSHFFHGIINSRRHRSRINGLNIHGNWITEPLKTRTLLIALSPLRKSKRSYGIVVKEFEVSALLPRGCNSSFTTLVPKVDDPLVVGDFCPISLIGSRYKIIAKILANRLSHVVSSVVGDVQMAYIKGRQIIDGLLMADEIIAWAKKYKKRVIYKWRTWIYSCLDLAFSSLLVNGSPTKEFKIQKGLRQGYPLSLFLFILAIEALNVALLEATNKNIFRGIKVGKDRIHISHLQFADDALIMREWSCDNAKNLSRIPTFFISPPV